MQLNLRQILRTLIDLTNVELVYGRFQNKKLEKCPQAFLFSINNILLNFVDPAFD